MSTETIDLDQANEPIPLRRPDDQDDNDGARVYSIDGTTGEVRDWRRPDTGEAQISTTQAEFKNGTGQVGDPVLVDGRRGKVEQFLFVPARTAKKNGRPAGWDVVISFEQGEPKERKLNPADVDLLLDEITRPSKPISDQTTAYGVPTDPSFGDEDVKEAADLRQIGLNLIQETDDFPDLKTLADRVAFFWAKKGGSSGGQPTLYRVRFATKHEKRTNGWRVVITFSADVCRTLVLKRDVIEAMVHESLCCLERDEHGNLRKLAPDFRGYRSNVERFGALVPPVRRAAEALANQVQDVRNLRLDLDETDEVEVGI